MAQENPSKNTTKDKLPKTKEAFVNEQVTKFFEIPFTKDNKSTKSDKNNQSTPKEVAPTSPLFHRTTKAPTKQHLQAKTNIDKSTSPAITITSWEETNKGQDEYTHGSHIRHSTSIDHNSHTSGENLSKCYRSNKSLPEEEQNLAHGNENGKLDVDSLSNSAERCHGDGNNKNKKFHDSLNNSVSPTGQEIIVTKFNEVSSMSEDHEKVDNDDSLERIIYENKNNVDTDSLVETTTDFKNHNNLTDLNNREGYYDSISCQDDYTITESEQHKRTQEPPKKKLVLPTSISFNDSFSSDTSPFNTSLDVSIDSVNNPSSTRKGDNGSALDSLENQIKGVPGLNRIQNGGIINSTLSIDTTLPNNHSSYHQQKQGALIHPSAATHFGAGNHQVMTAAKNPANLSYNILDPSNSSVKPINTSSVPSNQYANVPRPILANTNYLYGKPTTPYYGYGNNVNLYDATTTTHADRPHINNNKSKLPPPITPNSRHHSPSISRSQSSPLSHFPGSTLQIDPLEENISNGVKRDVHHQTAPPKTPISQTASHQNQSVVKMAAEKMKRKFLGWN